MRKGATGILGFCGVLLAMLVLGSCGGASNGGKPVVLCTIFSYFDAARAIGGDLVDVQILLPPGTSPHGYDTTVENKVTASRARLFVQNGLGLDESYAKLVQGSRTRVLDISKTIPQSMLMMNPEGDDHDHGPAGAEDHAHDHGLLNPHIWLDPRIQIIAAERIRDALVELVPSAREEFEARAAAYIADLRKLDEDFAAAAREFKTREFIGFHAAYDYMAHRYGLVQIASVEYVPGMSNIEETERVIKLIQEKGIKFIAVESAFDERGVRLIRERTGARTIRLQPLATYDRLSDTYIGLMRQNIETLKTALGS